MILERYLCFNLGTEEFGIPLLSVKEVLAVPDVTPIPFAPSHFIGIINLRGQVISLVDLRSKFAIKPSVTNETSVIICDLENTSIGIVVDSINSVISPTQEDLSPKPKIQGNASADYITFVYRKEGRMVLFLDVTKTFNLAEKTHLAKGSNHGKAA
jgi:purine-binding chemotaxis protein CheW